MTEEEARKKWCPIIKDICISSECMMWRNQPMVRDTDSGELYPDNGNILFSFGYEIVEGHGFCGLGGRP